VNVLIVEDDRRISSFLVKGLKAEGYSTTTAFDGDEARELIEFVGDDVDLVLLDLGLPGTSGRGVLEVLRRRLSAVPVIILTARDDLDSKVRGLDAGAADYITKPFAFEELLARMRAALRTRDQTLANQLEVADLRLDLLTKVAWRAGRPHRPVGPGVVPAGVLHAPPRAGPVADADPQSCLGDGLRGW
jgi:two-component system, OmpR family, response regulator